MLKNHRITREVIAHSIQNVVQRRLCTSCGACGGVCHCEAITFKIDPYGSYTPIVDDKKCNGCGICMRVCPGHQFDFAEQHRRIHGRLPEHPALGPWINIFTCYANNEDILSRSQSGGFVSSLLIHGIEQGFWDGAVVTRWRTPSAPLAPEVLIARNREDVLSAVGSIYNPVPTAMVIKRLLKETSRVAFVGTSCQIQAMRKAETVYPRLKERIKLYIGLHCLGVFTYHFHDQVLHKLRLSREDIKSFRHRDKSWRGWPCDMQLKDMEDQIYNLDAKNSRLWPRPYFTNWRCQLCPDKANEFSDVSCGDCRIPEEYDYYRNAGYNLCKGLSEVVVRTPRAKVVVDHAIQNGCWVIHQTSPVAVTRSIGVAGKKLGIPYFTKVARFFRIGIPDYGVQFQLTKMANRRFARCIHAKSILVSSRYYLFYHMSRYKAYRVLLKHIPHSFLGKLNRMLDSRVEYVAHAGEDQLTALYTKPEGN